MKMKIKSGKVFASYRQLKVKQVAESFCELKTHNQLKKNTSLVDEVLAGLVWSA